MRHQRFEGASVAVVFLLISVVFLLAVVWVPARASVVPLTGKYIMAFLACNTSTANCSDPQNHVTFLVESNDSVNWSPVQGFRPYPGSVPDVIRRGSTLYLYNPGTLVRFHLDTGAQDPPTSVSLKFTNGTSAIFVDPALILDSSGTIHLFYLPGMVGQDPAQCPVGQSTCTKRIMSATEVSGSDGGSFVVDSGTRADYSITGCCFSDPAVFQGPGGYYLYASEGQAVVAFDSPTLTGSYQPIQGLNGGVLVPQGTGGVPAGYYDNSSRTFWTFITHGQTVQTIARASTPSISSQISGSSFSTIVSGCNAPGMGCSYTVGSPGFHPNTSGPTSTTSTSSSSSTTTTSSSSSAATGVWTKDNGVRLNGASAPFVVALPDGRYRMYYCSEGIQSAISSDGLNWTLESGIRLAPGPPGSGESIVCDPTVVQLDDGSYTMYYKGANGSGGPGQSTQQIYSAISSDGLTFKREGLRISSVGTADNGWASVPEIVRTFDGKYRMYYVGNPTFQPVYQDYIVSAVSSDGLNFSREGIVGGLPPLAHDPAVIAFPNGTYWLFYACGTPQCAAIDTARSTDGRNFSLDSGSRVIPGGTYDPKMAIDPSVVLFPDGTYRVYYWDASLTTPTIVSASWKPSNPSPRGFSLAFSDNKSSLTVPSHGSQVRTYPLTVSWPPSFLGNISVSASWSGASPSGINYSLSPGRVTAHWKSLLSTSVNLTVSISSSAAPGNYSLSILGSSGGSTKSTTLSINLLAFSSTTSSTAISTSTSSSSTTASQTSSTSITTTTTPVPEFPNVGLVLVVSVSMAVLAFIVSREVEKETVV